jgi:hypothetical protein
MLLYTFVNPEISPMNFTVCSNPFSNADCSSLPYPLFPQDPDDLCWESLATGPPS